MLVSLSGSHFPKLLVSITIDQLARSGLIADGIIRLGGREPENETDNFGRCPLERALLNWTMMAKAVGLGFWFLSS